MASFFGKGSARSRWHGKIFEGGKKEPRPRRSEERDRPYYFSNRGKEGGRAPTATRTRKSVRRGERGGQVNPFLLYCRTKNLPLVKRGSIFQMASGERGKVDHPDINALLHMKRGGYASNFQGEKIYNEPRQPRRNKKTRKKWFGGCGGGAESKGGGGECLN